MFVLFEHQIWSNINNLKKNPLSSSKSQYSSPNKNGLVLDLQRNKMNELFHKFRFNSLEDWKKITKQYFSLNGGDKILQQYSNNYQKLLSTLYPNIDWIFLDENNLYIRKNYFSELGNQKKFMEELFLRLNLCKLGDWQGVSKSTINTHGGKKLLAIYENDMQKLLKTIYPHHDWHFGAHYLQSIIQQRNLMNQLYFKFNLNHIGEWLHISKSRFKNGGGISILELYSNDMSKLLSIIYPNYPWEFITLNFRHPSDFFKDTTNQRLFVDNIYDKLKLISVENWLTIPLADFINNGGKYLLYNYYLGDFIKLLSTIYPNFPFPLSDRPRSLSSLINQQALIDRLYKKFNLQSIEDWLEIPKRKIIKNGGQGLIIYHYKNDIKKLWKTIYPNYPFDFDAWKKKRLFRKHVQLMDKLFIELGLNKLDDWKKVSRTQLLKIGGRNILKYYSDDIGKLLSSIYPSHKWEFEKREPYNHFRYIENQRKFMDNLYRKLKLKSLDDWIRISKNKINIFGGQNLLSYYYSNSLSKLLETVYPDHPWFFKYFKSKKIEYFQSLENQKDFMDTLYENLKLSTLDDWINVPRSKYLEFGGAHILSLYSNDIQQLLFTIYSNHNWPFDIEQTKIRRNQQKKLIKIFHQLQLNTMEDWLTISKSNFIILGGGKDLLEVFSNNMRNLLETLFPNYSWDFKRTQLVSNTLYTKADEFIKYKINSIQKKYMILRKNDWYRLSTRTDEINIYRALKKQYPDEKWDKELFQMRSKKSNQRILLNDVQRIYPNFLIVENYRHPHLEGVSGQLLELDVFLPALQFAFEYQGEHHYDDIPTGFGQLDLYKANDILKIDIAKKINIKLVIVPYWWDQSLSSLISTCEL